MANDHVGQLLSEYLRVINEKDNQVQKLIKDMEDLRASHKKQAEQFKSKINLLKSEIHVKGEAEMRFKDKLAESEVVISKFLAINETLEGELQAKHRELEEVSGKLSAAYDKLQKEAEEHVETIAKLMHQVEECNAELKEADLKQQHLEEKENAHRLTMLELQNKVQLSEDTIHDLNETVTLLRSQLQTSIPRQEHERYMVQIETKSLENTANYERSTATLRQQLYEMETKTKELTSTLNQCQQSLQEAVVQRESSVKEVNELRQQHQGQEHALETTRREAQLWKEACEKANNAKTEIERVVASKDDQLHRLTENLQETRLMLERATVQAGAAEKSLQVQLATASNQAKQHQEETERCHRQLENKENALRDAMTALNTFKDSAALSNSTLRDQLATSGAALSVCKEENERLKHELKQAQMKQQETQHLLNQEVTALRSKVEEHQSVAQANWQRLRDKEEEMRRLELIHDKALSEKKYEHTSAMEGLCRSKDAEIQDMHSRLERCRTELLDHSGGNKSLSQNLERYAESTRQLKEELGRVQSLLASRDETIMGLRRNMEDANSKIVQQEQRHTADLQMEEQLRRRVEAVEREREAVRSALTRSEATVADRDSVVRKLEETITKIHGSEQAQEAHLQTLRRQVAEHQEIEQLSKKELASREIQIVKLSHNLAQTEAQLAEMQAALNQARQNTEVAQSAVRAAEGEASRLRAELENRSCEFRRTAEHAKEIEELARKKTEELRQAIESRDETIATLQRERSTILPHLNEEQSKNLILQEKLQHYRELEQLTLSGLQERIADLETILHAKETEIVAAKELNTETQQRFEEVQAQLQNLQGALESREKKYFTCKEELRKAFAALEMEKTAASNQAERLESEIATNSAMHKKYKKEKARLESLLKQLEEKLVSVTRSEKATQHRESVLLKDLQAAEAALENFKTRSKQSIEFQSELRRYTTPNVTELERKCTDLQHQLKAAHKNAASAQNACSELQRRLPDRGTHSVDYAKEVIAMKAVFSELMIEFYRDTVRQGRLHLHDSWIACQKSGHEYEAKARELMTQRALELEKMKVDHDLAMDAALNRHRTEIAQLMEQHRAELVESRQGATERAYESRREKETMSWTLQEKEEALHAVTTELDCARVEVAHLRKQLHTLQEQRNAAEVRLSELERKLDEERRTQRRHNEALQRKLNDSTAEHRHNEDELHELRAEVTALQRLMSEQQKLITEERAELASATEELKQVQGARDNAIAQLKDLKKQVVAAKSQVEALQERHQQALSSLRQAHDADRRCLGERQAQLEALSHEGRRLQRCIATQHQRIDAVTGELQAARMAEAELLAQLHALTAELSALRERCANLESLKHISDTTLAETQLRERNLVGKLEELRSSQQLMQVCFDKQQEQLEVGRRLQNQRSE